jgi:hypothetical protein
MCPRSFIKSTTPGVVRAIPTLAAATGAGPARATSATAKTPSRRTGRTVSTKAAGDYPLLRSQRAPSAAPATVAAIPKATRSANSGWFWNVRPPMYPSSAP